MLKHEEVEIEPIPAAAARVTPEELAAAITRIEARKEAHQRHQEGTVAIGDVAQQLGLDATPEEVLAEVQAERARQKPLPKRRLSTRQCLGLWLATGATVVGLGLAGLWATPSHIVSPGTNNSTASSVSDTINQPQRLQLDPDHLQVGAAATGKLVLLSEVGDNQMVHCPLYASENATTCGDYSSGDAAEAWPLIKHGGQLYLRGWISRVSNKLLQADGVDIENHRNAENSVPITLPVNGFTVLPSSVTASYIEGTQFPDGGRLIDCNITGFHAEDIHPDKHAYEKW